MLALSAVWLKRLFMSAAGLGIPAAVSRRNGSRLWVGKR
ncbi:hypothetical protein [Pseudomonas sp. GOM7]